MEIRNHMFELNEPGSFRLCADPLYELDAQKQIGALAEAIPREIGHFAPLGLILTGSLARGEGSLTRDEQGKPQWLSDIECLVVFTDARRAEAAAINAALSRTALALVAAADENCAGLKIQLNLIFSSRLLAMRPAIFTRELATHGKLLWAGCGSVPSPSAALEPVPHADGFRLLNNRIVEKLPVRARLAEVMLDHTAAWYTLRKFWLDLGSSLSVFLDCYRPSYRERSEVINAAVLSRPEIFSPPTLERALACMHQAETIDTKKLVPADSFLPSAFDEAAEAAQQVWDWESKQLLHVDNDRGGWARVPHRLRRIQSTSQRIRDWARLLLRTRKLHTVGARAIPAMLRAGSYGGAIYGAACLLDFYWDEAGAETPSAAAIRNSIGELLGIEIKGSNGRQEAARRTFNAWQTHLRDAAW